MKRLLCAVAGLFVIATPARSTQAENDAAMLRLATYSGCMTCHHIQPAARRADGLPPIAPAWRDVAIKYRGVGGADDRLTRAVMTGSNPYASHWQGKVNGLPMPPNEVEINEADARMLVNWILTLDR